MAVVVPSRFALLKIVEDDYKPKQKEHKEQKEAQDKADKPKKQDKKKIADEKQKPAKVNPKKGKTHRKKNIQPEPAPEENPYLDDSYEERLRQALQLSELEMRAAEEEEAAPSSPQQEPFQFQAKPKKHKNKPAHVQEAREPPSMDELRGLHFANTLQEKDREILELKSTVADLKEQLSVVKIRNKKLCSIIGSGEMKDKAVILAESLQMHEVQMELTSQVAKLHAELEQYKSKGVSKVDKPEKTKEERCKDIKQKK